MDLTDTRIGAEHGIHNWRVDAETIETIENATVLKCLRIGSCGIAIGPHCVANLYQGELQ